MRRAAWIMLIVATLVITGGVALVAGAGAPALGLLSVVVIITMAGGLLAGVPWLITAALGLIVVEIGSALVGGSLSESWVPGLAVGLFLAVEASTVALETSGGVIAPHEPVGRRLLAIAATAGMVGAVAAVAAILAGGADLPGTFTQIAGVTAAAAVLATLARLIESRL